MPCYSVIRNQVKIQAADRNILKRGIERMGWTTVALDQDTGTMTVRAKNGTLITITQDQATVQQGNESLVDQMKRAYSKEVLLVAAEKYDWTVTEVGENQYEVERSTW